LFGKTPSKAQNDYAFQKFRGNSPFAPPGYTYARSRSHVREKKSSGLGAASFLRRLHSPGGNAPKKAAILKTASISFQR